MRRAMIPILWAPMAVALATLVGCTTAERREYALEVPWGSRLLAVDVESFNGRVEIRADRGDEVLVESRVRGPWGASGDELDRVASAVEVDAQIEEMDGLSVLRVRTWTSEPGAGHAADLWINVPRCDGLRVINEGGDVEVVGTGGRTHIENRFGHIQVRTNRELNEDVTLLVVDGNILLQAPPGSKGHFDLETLDGEAVMRDFSGDSADTYSTGTTLEATLGGGENVVLARTNKGDVRVWVMENAQEMTRMFKGSIPDGRDYLFLKGSRAYTRNRPETEPE